MAHLCFLSIAEASRLVAAGDLDPVELTRAHLERIAALNPKLNAYITVSAKTALVQASEAKRRRTGRLRGIPLSYKDLIATAGIRTTGGSRVLGEWVPDRDAFVVDRLRRSGAVTLGKATLNEFAFSATSEQDFVRPARNPWNRAAPPGLSSSGSGVAVAAGLAMASIGTDSGGSIRIPASYCGVTGLKPTYGLIGRTGVLPLSYSCDHVGIMARSAEDVAIVLTAAAGHDQSDPASLRKAFVDYAAGINQPVRGCRLGVCRAYMEAVGLEADVEAAVKAAIDVLRSLGSGLQDIEIPHLTYAPAADFTILRVEGFNTHLKNLKEKRSLYGSSAFRQIASGGVLSTVDYYRAHQARRLIAGEVDRALDSVDALVMPTTPRSAMPASPLKTGSEAKVSGSGVAFLAPFNLTGHPALSAPCGFTKGGLPIGLQLVGPAFGEPLLLRLAHAFQKATRWHLQRPPL